MSKPMTEVRSKMDVEDWETLSRNCDVEGTILAAKRNRIRMCMLSCGGREGRVKKLLESVPPDERMFWSICGAYAGWEPCKLHEISEQETVQLKYGWQPPEKEWTGREYLLSLPDETIVQMGNVVFTIFKGPDGRTKFSGTASLGQGAVLFLTQKSEHHYIDVIESSNSTIIWQRE